MNKLIIFSLATLCLFSAQAYAANPLQCIADVEQLLPAVVAIKNDVSSSNILDIIHQVQVIVSLVPQMKADCLPSSTDAQLRINPTGCIQDVEQVVSEVESLVQDISNKDTNINDYLTLATQLESSLTKAKADCATATSFVKLNPLQCLADVSKVATVIVSVKNDISSKNLLDLISQVQSLIQLVPQIKADCLSQSAKSFIRLNPTACVYDIEQVVSEIETLVSDLKNKDTNINDYLSLATQIQQTVVKAKTDCAPATSFVKLNPLQCLSDVEKVGSTIVAVKNDISSKNFGDLIQQFEALVQLVPEVKADCLSQTTESALRLNPAACVQDVEQAVSEIQTLVNDIKNKDTNINDYLTLASQIEQTVVKAKTDCSVATSFVKINPLQCLADVEQLVATLKSLQSDLSSFNVADLLQQIQHLQTEVGTLKTDCLSQQNLQLNPLTCIQDIEAGVTGVEQLVNDFKAGDKNISDYLTLINSLITDLNKAKTDCSANAKKFLGF